MEFADSKKIFMEVMNDFHTLGLEPVKAEDLEEAMAQCINSMNYSGNFITAGLKRAHDLRQLRSRPVIYLCAQELRKEGLISHSILMEGNLGGAAYSLSKSGEQSTSDVA
jgi:hypothetical protein